MKVKKNTGIIFIIIGVIGFFYASSIKGDKLVFNERVSSYNLESFQVNVDGGENYEIKFWGVDEEMTGVFQQPYFEAQLSIRDGQNHLLFNQDLMSIHEIETGGKRTTHDGLDYLHSPKSNEVITISAQIIKGDYLDIEVYKNLDSETDALPGVFIIIAIIGVFVYFRSRKR